MMVPNLNLGHRHFCVEGGFCFRVVDIRYGSSRTPWEYAYPKTCQRYRTVHIGMRPGTAVSRSYGGGGPPGSDNVTGACSSGSPAPIWRCARASAALDPAGLASDCPHVQPRLRATSTAMGSMIESISSAPLVSQNAVLAACMATESTPRQRTHAPYSLSLWIGHGLSSGARLERRRS
jgi:hypothetical protein